MEIDTVNVYGFNESIIASGLPMRSEYDSSVFESQVLGLTMDEYNMHFTRVSRLCNNPTSSGHLTFLSGIIVQMNITATVKWWEQWQRYHFQQIVSSMSTMHRLKKMVEEDTIRFDPKTNQGVIAEFKKTALKEDVTAEELAYSCPMGVLLTARVSANYLQLRTMYHQRKHHKLEEWRDFCQFVETLPCADKFITLKK